MKTYTFKNIYHKFKNAFSLTQIPVYICNCDITKQEYVL